ncbi:MAG: polymer-forming cytoskeletal protein [Deltaproteobacteria bacterium]|nr:polymer-forming cytoskeletal protein [Deltaproteobacteria bacterium]
MKGSSRKVLWGILASLGVLGLGLGASVAFAEVKREGDWPKQEELVTLSVDGQPRAAAIRQLAAKAGWNVVVELPDGGSVDLDVRDQDAAKVLELLLADGRYVARRSGSLVGIAPERDAAAAAPAAAPAAPSAAGPAAGAPPPPEDEPEPAERGEDRMVTGGSTRIERGEVVHDVVVMGGSAEILGRVTGDVAVMGGGAKIRDGARVRGDVSVLGGELTIEDGASVRGDVSVLGGELHRGKKAHVGGDVTDQGGRLRFGSGAQGEEEGLTLASLAHDAGGAMTRMALLFVFGAVLFGLATRRMELLQTAAAARPMRAFAWGVLGALVAAVVLVALCVTIIGIPLAFVAALVGAFAAYAGMCGVLAALGAALVRHKSTNPYVHLGVGCVLYLLLSAIPWVGGLITAVLVLVGIGAVVATRGAGLLPERKGQPSAGGGPYRTAAAV